MNTRISLATRGMTTDLLALFSVWMEPIIMGRQFVEVKAEHLRVQILMGSQFVERRAERPPRRIMGQPIMAVQRPKTQSSTGTNQSNSYFEEKDDGDAYKDGTYDGGTYNDGNNDNSYAAQSWSTPPPSYDSVHRTEPLWQPYYMDQYAHEIETVDELQHLGTFGMKMAYRFGTHEDNPLAKQYTKLDPQVLVIASSLMAGQRRGHSFLSSRQAAVVLTTNATIYNLRDVGDIDSWRKTALLPSETMQSAPDTSFDESGTPGSAPSYQWYTKIEVACQNFRNALVDWRKCN